MKATKGAKGAKATLSSKHQLFAIKNSMYRLKETDEREALVCPAQPTPTTFSAGFAHHLLMMVFASTAWHSPICSWQEMIGETSGTQSATSGSCLCDCRCDRRQASQLMLLRGLCPSPNLLMPGVTAQTRSRTWRLQFWLARRGETDAVSVMCFCCITTSYTTILLSYCSLTPPYYAILHCKR